MAKIQKWTEEEDALLLVLFSAGVPFVEIAARMNRTMENSKYRLRKLYADNLEQKTEIGGLIEKLETKKQATETQKCWECAKATGGCSWSMDFEPVKGWTAEPAPNASYKIIDCPEFEQWERKKK